MIRITSTTIAITAVLGGCLADDPDDPTSAEVASSEAIAGTCPVGGTDISRSLVVTDPEVLTRFGFARVFNRLRNTAGVAANQTNLELFQTWMRTFDVGPGGCDDARIDPDHYGLVCPRPSEARLATLDPFSASGDIKFLPVGLFNRFDLAPSDGSHCGEYRIVYGMQSANPAAPPPGRAFIIFEGILPNPDPAQGINGCLPIAQFWQDLSNDADVVSRAGKLEKLYFTGGAIPGLRAVVNAAAYGLADGANAVHGSGQIRTNFFIDFFEWNLREFKLRRTCTSAMDPTTCRLAVEHVMVKTNPAEELFANTHPRSEAFIPTFLAQVRRLASPGINQIGMTTPEVDDEFESVSQRFDVSYDLFATSGLRTRIQNRLDSIGSMLTPSDILQRATTQTCAGCHQVSNGQALGGGRRWPSSLGFVQIDEASNLSPALTGTFLPHRRAVLERFINARCGSTPPPPYAAGETIGGSAVGAAN